MRPDSARPIGFTGRDFRDKFSRANTVVSTNREDARRDCPLLCWLAIIDRNSLSFFILCNMEKSWRV